MVFQRDDGYYQYSINIGSDLLESVEWIENNLTGSRAGAGKMAISWGLNAYDDGEFGVDDLDSAGLVEGESARLTLSTKDEEHVERIEEFIEAYHDHHGTESDSVPLRVLVAEGWEHRPVDY